MYNALDICSKTQLIHYLIYTVNIQKTIQKTKVVKTLWIVLTMNKYLLRTQQQNKILSNSLILS